MVHVSLSEIFPTMVFNLVIGQKDAIDKTWVGEFKNGVRHGKFTNYFG